MSMNLKIKKLLTIKTLAFFGKSCKISLIKRLGAPLTLAFDY
jgi:hypothetical protein